MPQSRLAFELFILLHVLATKSLRGDSLHNSSLVDPPRTETFAFILPEMERTWNGKPTPPLRVLQRCFLKLDATENGGPH